MPSIRKLLPVATILVLGGCVSGPPPQPAAMVVPGPGKDVVAFQQDDQICRQHAEAQTGYGPPVQAPSANSAAAAAPSATPTAQASNNAPASSAAELPASMPPNAVGYMQCMAARGDSVQQLPPAYVASYAPGLYPYGYGYPFPYVGYYGGLGFGWGWGHGWGYNRWHRGGWGHSGWGHAGFGRGGFGHTGGGHH